MSKSEVLIVLGICLAIGFGLWYIAPMIPVYHISNGLRTTGTILASAVHNVIPTVQGAASYLIQNWQLLIGGLVSGTVAAVTLFSKLYNKLKTVKEQEVTETKNAAFQQVADAKAEITDLKEKLAVAQAQAPNVDTSRITELEGQLAQKTKETEELQSRYSEAQRLIKTFVPKEEKTKVA